MGSMNVSEVLDVEGSFTSTPLKVGDIINILSWKIKHVDSVDADVAEITTTEGLRHTFAKAICGQVGSEHWNFVIEKCLEKDASDGLTAYVEEKPSNTTGRMMLTLSMHEHKQKTPKGA